MCNHGYTRAHSDSLEHKRSILFTTHLHVMEGKAGVGGGSEEANGAETQRLAVPRILSVLLVTFWEWENT